MLKATIKIICGIAMILALSLASGCSLNLVSDYDRASQQQMMKLMQKIDGFYLHMQHVDVPKRQYSHYASSYLNIEVDVNALLQRQKVRSLNELTIKQVEILLQLWQQARKAHQEQNSISDFIIKRRRSEYQRVLLAMIRGEKSKAP
ncbi:MULTISPECIES: hypothetical protein [Pseudoalteromonas]|uniref:Lipoprotein n=1 Tax=Pseudoalteromonas obscura TaxID=3048491 RepID=A0ABT7ET75_9GAMM|nr:MULTISPECIES: hypothetical protein [Pseudoalteromonas]MBQ4839334.1 hypothetical protein [Pseudoalteromonas luteoviolacea]MDK2598175.1 hypothetical protein [Pseudoalteromonas sp. P94(2023)]